MDRAQAHEVIDQLDANQFAIFSEFLETLVEPPRVSVENEQPDDGELTPSAIAAIEAGSASIARGECISHEELMREFGLESAIR